MYAGVNRKTMRIVGIAHSASGIIWNPDVCDTHEIPEQDFGHIIVDGPMMDGSKDFSGVWPTDLVQYEDGELLAVLVFREDETTEEQINRRVHSSTPFGEQIGIIRNQIVSLSNKLGIDLTSEMMALNKIAIEEIEAGTIRKAALDA